MIKNMIKRLNLKQNWFLYLLLFDISFILLFPKLPLLNVSGTYVAIRIEDFLIALTCTIWVCLNFKNIFKILSQRVTQVFILFWLSGLLSVIAGVWVNYEVSLHLGVLHWLRRIEVMSLFFIAATTIDSQRKVKIILKSIFFITLVVVLYGFGQIFLDFPVISTTNKEFSKGLVLKLTPGARPNSTFAGHYDLAVFLSIALIYLASFFFFFEGKKNSFKNLWQKGLMFATGVLSFLLLAFTAARVSFVATLVSVTLVFWCTRKKILIVGLILLSILAVGLVPELRHRLVATITVNILEGGGPKYNPPPNTVNIFTPDSAVDSSSKEAIIKESIESTRSATVAAKRDQTVSADIAPGEPLNTTELGVERSLNIRTDVEWPRAIRAFRKNFISGTGYSSLTIATDNDFLRSLGETGILGTLSLILVFLIIIKTLIKGLKKVTGFDRLFVLSSLSTILAVLLTGLFIDVLEASKIAIFFWFILGIAWSVAKGYDKN